MIRVQRSHDLVQFDTPVGNRTAPLASPATGAADVLAIRQHQAPGGSTPLHRKSTEALIVVLDGAIAVGTPDESTDLAPGDSAIVAAGDLHQIRTTGSTPADWIVVTPGGVRFSGEDGTPIEPAWAT
ncbi:MAG: cupin domain-containing protein [Acidimicrobiales bacterium]